MLGSVDYIGIDIGQYAIKIAKVKSGKNFSATLLAYEVITDENRDKDSLKKLIGLMLKRLKITKGQPVIHINIGEAILRDVYVQEGTTKENLEGAIQLELTPAIPFQMDQVYFDFDEKPNADGSNKVVAARRDIVDQKIALLAERAKTLNAPEIDVDVFAFERLIDALQRGKLIQDQTIALLDIGHNQSRFMIYQNREYAFGRDLQIGGKQVDEIIRDVYDISLADAQTRKLSQNLGQEYHNLVLTPYLNSFAEQINLATDFYAASSDQASQVECIYLTGGGAQLQGLVEGLRNLITVPLNLLDLSSQVKLNSGVESSLQNGLSHGLAIGLAMEGK